jgi:DNA-binding beta-propeller fold protein YncE
MRVFRGFTAAAMVIAAAVAIARAQSSQLLYVCVQDDAKIAVVDMAKAEVVRTIDLTKLGFPTTAKPHFIVVEPDGAYWYASLIGANKVVKFDRQDKIAGQYEMETPGMLSFSADGKLVVSRSMSAVNPPKRVALIDRTKMTGDEVDILFPRPHPVAVVGGYAYTASLGVNQLASIQLATDKVQITDVKGPSHGFVQFAVSPDKKTLVASTEVSGQLMVFDLSTPAAPTLTAEIPLGKMVFDPVFTFDGKHVWVPVKMNNEVAVIDASTWKVVARIADPAFKQPHQIVFSADGKTAFVTTNNKSDHMADPAHAGMPGMDDGTASLVVVDVATRKVTKSLPLGKNLTGMGTRAR